MNIADRWVPLPTAEDRTNGLIEAHSFTLGSEVDEATLEVHASALVSGAITIGGFDKVVLGITDTAESDSNALVALGNDTHSNLRHYRNGTLSVLPNGVPPSDHDTDFVDHLDKAVRVQAAQGVREHNLSDAYDGEFSAQLGRMAFYGDFMVYAVALEALVTRDFGRLASAVGGRVALSQMIRGGVSLQAANQGIQSFSETWKSRIDDPLSMIARPTRAVVGSQLLRRQRLIRSAAR